MQLSGSQPDFWQQAEQQRLAAGEELPQNVPMLVAVRCRPLSRDEHDSEQFGIVRVIESRVVVVVDPHEYDQNLQPNRSKEKKYAFDKAFDESATQGEIFRGTTRGLVGGVLEGYNASVFAYGATGAGKTYTMLGALDAPGVMVLTLNDMFRRMRSEPQFAECEFKVRLSYLEIYNEVIKDLLNPSESSIGLPLNEDPARGMVVAGITEYDATSAGEVLQLLHQGNMARAQEPTAANKTSSRSHAILQVTVEQSERTAHLAGVVKFGKLSLIDLAGSERASKTENTGMRLKEGANINRSLLALGNCINALADGRSHVPYRDSKMTRLLKDSLGGNCRTVMIANVSPASSQFEETLNTLKYANRAKNLKTKVHSNVASVSAHVAEYQRIIGALRAEIAELKAAQAGAAGAAGAADGGGSPTRGAMGAADLADAEQARALQHAVMRVCAERRQLLQQLDSLHAQLVNANAAAEASGHPPPPGSDQSGESAAVRARLSQNEHLANELLAAARQRVRSPERLHTLQLLLQAQFLDMARSDAAYELRVRQSYVDALAQSSPDLPPSALRAVGRLGEWGRLRSELAPIADFHERMARVELLAPHDRLALADDGAPVELGSASALLAQLPPLAPPPPPAQPSPLRATGPAHGWLPAVSPAGGRSFVAPGAPRGGRYGEFVVGAPHPPAQPARSHRPAVAAPSPEQRERMRRDTTTERRRAAGPGSISGLSARATSPRRAPDSAQSSRSSQSQSRLPPPQPAAAASEGASPKRHNSGDRMTDELSDEGTQLAAQSAVSDDGRRSQRPSGGRAVAPGAAAAGRQGPGGGASEDWRTRATGARMSRIAAQGGAGPPPSVVARRAGAPPSTIPKPLGQGYAGRAPGPHASRGSVQPGRAAARGGAAGPAPGSGAAASRNPSRYYANDGSRRLPSGVHSNPTAGARRVVQTYTAAGAAVGTSMPKRPRQTLAQQRRGRVGGAGTYAAPESGARVSGAIMPAIVAR